MGLYRFYCQINYNFCHWLLAKCTNMIIDYPPKTFAYLNYTTPLKCVKVTLWYSQVKEHFSVKQTSYFMVKKNGLYDILFDPFIFSQAK